MEIDCDPVKREATLRERKLDMLEVGPLFDGPTLTTEDDRFDYGETRLITIGFLNSRMLVVVWTARGDTRWIISMRKANDREQKAYAPRFQR